jgi:hypothetical protein
VLRWLLALLIAANLGVWAWSQAAITHALGLPAWDSQREPERLARQVHPEAIRLLPAPSKRAAASTPASGASSGAAEADSASASAPGSASPSAPAASAPDPKSASAALVPPPGVSVAGSAPANTVCMQQGPLNDTQFQATTTALSQLGLRSDAWVDIRRELPPHWAVYMGRFVDGEQLQKKRDELRRLGIPHEALLKHPTLSPGLTLGDFDAEAGAKGGLEQLQRRGVRTARVVELTPSATEHRVRLEGVKPDSASRIRANPAAAAQGAWGLCGSP